jgi:hypothetical protein
MREFARHIIGSNYYRILQGVMCKMAASSSTSGHRWTGATGRRWRRRSERPRARPRQGEGRGSRGKLEDVLTGGGEEGERPDSGRRRRACRLGPAASLGTWRRHAAQRARAPAGVRGLAFIGVRAREA